MSEYQYYAFRAIDRALTAAQMKELRGLSTRARISPTSFVNEYNWGDFKGRPKELMERYFDFHFYFANWGTRIMMVRVPKHLLDPKIAAAYCPGQTVETWIKGDHVFLDVTSEEEPEYDEEVDVDFVEPLLGLRGELMRGDHRLLYLLWLLDVQAGAVDDREQEPPVPAGLDDPTMAQLVFCDVMRLDLDLVRVAAEGSMPVAPGATTKDITAWLQKLPATDKDAWLERLVAGETVTIQAEVLTRYRATQQADRPSRERRTVAELLEIAEARAKKRQREEARERAADQAELERKAAAEKAKRLDALATREAKAWEQVDAFIASRKPTDYDAAVALLCDLRDLDARDGRDNQAWRRIGELRTTHAKKPTLIERLDKAKLVPPGT